jgi:hypothetical protein
VTAAVQYLSIRYTERLAENGVEASVGSVGDSYDNALAETVIGLFKTEVIYARGPWRPLETVEYATLEWVDWFNNRRLLEPIGHVPPAEFEEEYYRQQAGQLWRPDSNPEFSGEPGAGQKVRKQNLNHGSRGRVLRIGSVTSRCERLSGRSPKHCCLRRNR